MARIKQGIFGPLSGKLGPVIGSTWKGIPYIKERSVKDENPKPRTQAQLDNQAKFKFINDWLVPFHSFFTVGFSLEATQRTEIAAALKANYKSVFAGKWPEMQINYPALQMSVGALPGLQEPVIELLNPHELVLTWKSGLLRGCRYNDQLMLALYCPEHKITDGFIGGVSRAMETCRHQLDLRIVGHPLEVYLSATSLDRKNIANTTYLGRIVP